MRTLLFLLLSLPAPALACSVSGPVLPDTGYESSRDANAIVIARVSGHTPATSGPGTFTMEVESRLRGTTPKTLTLRGDLRRPGNMLSKGPCSRVSFRLGARVLLLLTHGPHGWSPLGDTDGLSYGEVTGQEDPWLVVIRHYLKVQAMPASKRRRRLLELRLLAEGKVDPRAYPHIMAHDIETYLYEPTVRKSFEAHAALLAKARPGHRRARVMHALTRDPRRAAPLLRAHMTPKSHPFELQVLGAHFTRRPDPKVRTKILATLQTLPRTQRWSTARAQLVYAALRNATAEDAPALRALLPHVHASQREAIERWLTHRVKNPGKAP